MNTEHAHEPALDRLLSDTSEVDPVSQTALAAARDALLSQSEARVSHAARVVRLRRRHRRLTAGIAAAAVVGVVTTTVLAGTSQDRSGVPRAETAETGSPTGLVSPPSAPVEVQYTTVAQVVRAAATSSVQNTVDPTASPYWKVVTQWDCSGVPDAAEVERPTGATCENTIWTGNGRPGVIQNADGDAMQIPAGTVSVDGREIAWATANARQLTSAQIASMVADNADGSKSDRAPSEYYIFKNALELLGGSPASPAIRQELWRQLGQVDGVTFNGRATDSLGRSGWRLTWSSRTWGAHSIIIDTATGMALETSDKAPGVATWNVSTILSSEGSETAPNALSNAEIKGLLKQAMRACGIAGTGTRFAEGQPLGEKPLTARPAPLTAEQKACLAKAQIPLQRVD